MLLTQTPLAGFILLALAVGARAATTQPADTGDAMVSENFDDARADRPLLKAMLKNKYISHAAGEGVGGSGAVRAKYVGGTMGSQRIIVTHPLPEPGLEMTLCYDVKFDADFQFVRGGKLHGLGPDAPVAGGNAMTPGGWSARLMFNPDGKLATYLYEQLKKSKYGSGRQAKDFRFVPGRYHAVSLYVRLNDPPEAANGETRVYVDGQPVIEQHGLKYRSVGGDDTLISRLLFNTFHGGNAPDWAPKSPDGTFADVYAYFDNIAVHRGQHVRPAR